MAIKASSIEDFLKKYTSYKSRVNAAKTLDEFTRLEGYDHEGKYLGALRAAMQARARGGAYGALGEEVGRGGLASGGYREHLEALAAAEYKDDVAAARAQKSENTVSAAEDYADYLGGYKRQQESLKATLRDRLLDGGITDLETTYSIGISRGLSAEEAASLSVELYNLKRNEIYATALMAVATARLDAEGVRSFAERAGLVGDDVEQLVEEAKRYAIDGDRYTEEMMHELEELAGKDYAVDLFNGSYFNSIKSDDNKY